MTQAVHHQELETEGRKESSDDELLSFLETFLHQLQVQSGVIKEEDIGSHPDELIRRSLKGLLDSLSGDGEPPLREVIVKLPNVRKHIDATHLADLIARAVQYIFRMKDDTSYLKFTDDNWRSFYSSLLPEQVSDISYILVHKEVATHVLTRYRGLSALNTFFYQQTQTPLKIADIGCSLRYGLRDSVKVTMKEEELHSFVDLTDGKVIKSLLLAEKPAFSYALGIDIQPPDFDWVAACAYYSKYDETRKGLQQYRNQLDADERGGVPIHCMTADIAEESTVLEIQSSDVPKFDIIYGSMVLYQLSKKMRVHAISNINTLLQPNGVFAELTFKNTRNWFLPWNAITTVRFKNGAIFTEPYQWLEWDSSRCGSVRPGKDYELVNDCIRGVKYHHQKGDHE